MPNMDNSPPALSLTREEGAPLDPPRQYAQLRRDSPITRVSAWGGRMTPWLITRWEDARTVLSSPGVSSQSWRPGFPTPVQNAPQTPPGFFVSQDDAL
jgi:hypothetical protein